MSEPKAKVVNIDADGCEDWIKWRTKDVSAAGGLIEPKRHKDAMSSSKESGEQSTER